MNVEFDATGYRKVYRTLINAGHTPAKAAEIVLDARRGDQHALDWIKAITGEYES